MSIIHTVNNEQSVAEDESVNLLEYFDILLDSRWLIIGVAVLFGAIGVAYSLLTTPVYESNILVQVEDSDKSAGSFLGDAASSVFDVKTPSAGEIEILRSRLILGQAVENTKLYIDATPKYVPLIGRWLARRSTELSDPGFFGLEGVVSGTESIVVPKFDVPSKLEGEPFTLTTRADGNFELTSSKFADALTGKVGVPLTANVPDVGLISILVSDIQGKPGAKFNVNRFSKLLVLNDLQDSIRIAEKGKQSGVIDVTLQSSNPTRMTDLLNEIGRIYVRQNIERKAAEAEKTLGFLDGQLPEFKRQLERSETVYNNYRNQKGTISLDEEAKSVLAKLLDLQTKLLEAQQKRRELEQRFTNNHPSVKTIDAQIADINSDIAGVNAGIKNMPSVQQDTVRMQRDIKVNTDLYVSLLNSSLQMSLAKEGKVGNVRLLDEAVIPEVSVKPRRTLVVLISILLGVFFGTIVALIRSSLFGGIRSPNEIESHTGLNVYSAIPLSNAQVGIDRDIKRKIPGVHLLSIANPEDPAIESLRSLRTALQFATLNAKNNRVIISGGTPGVGKSFVSANFAAIVANSGKKVLLVDADLRKGYIHQLFSLQRASGLSELITGSIGLVDGLHREVVPGLDFISTGVLPPNPAELLMSQAFLHLLDLISGNYDLVIIDTAPVLVAADTVSVAPHAGTILLVARAERTNLGELTESVKRLTQVGCNVNGVILNAMDLSRRHAGRYGYKYGGYKYTQYKYGSNSN